MSNASNQCPSSESDRAAAAKDLPVLKGRCPCRLGTSSYILQDAILPNARFLAGLVDDIELILFESEQISNLPTQDDIRTLADIAREHDLSYTVHLPLDADLGHPEPERRQHAVDSCRRVIDLTRELHPFAYVAHFHLPPKEAAEKDPGRTAWCEALDSSMEAILGSGVEPARICAETLSYPFEWVDRIVAQRGLSVCMDIGHILLNGFPLDEYMERYWAHTRVLHVHGIVDRRDHRALASDATWVRPLLQRLSGEKTERVMTVEVFNLPDFAASMAFLQECLLHKPDGRHGGRPSTVEHRAFSGGSGSVPTASAEILQKAQETN